jgi:hypothetical protein
VTGIGLMKLSEITGLVSSILWNVNKNIF